MPRAPRLTLCSQFPRTVTFNPPPSWAQPLHERSYWADAPAELSTHPSPHGTEACICSGSYYPLVLPGGPPMREWTISPPMLALLLRDAHLHLPIISFRAAPFGCFAPPAPALSLCPRIPTTLFSSCPRSRLGVLTFSRQPHRGCPPFRRGSLYTPPLPVFSRHPSLPLSRAPPFTHAVRRFHRKILMPARAKA